MTPKFEVGNVGRLSFKWPQDAKKERTDGSKERHVVYFQTDDGGMFASPISSVPPEAGQEKYAIKLTPRLQRDLGLDPSSPSWLKANYVNYVQPPNPAMRKWAKRGQNEVKYVIGQVPPGLIQLLEEKRKEAIADGKVKPQVIPRHDVARELKMIRGAAPKTPAVEADGDAERRHLPNDPDRYASRLQRIQDAASKKAKTLSLPKTPRAESRRDQEL